MKGQRIYRILVKIAANLLSDELLENNCVCSLRVSKIHQLVEKLVDHHEIVAYAFLLELLEVLGEHLHKLVQEDKNKGDVGISASSSDKVHVVVLDVRKVRFVVLHNGRRVTIFLSLGHKRQELVDDAGREVSTVVAREQNLRTTGLSRHARRCE